MRMTSLLCQLQARVLAKILKIMKGKKPTISLGIKLKGVKSVHQSCVRLKLCFVVYVSPLRDGFVLLNVDIEKREMCARAKKVEISLYDHYANRLSWFHWHWLRFDYSFRTWLEVISAFYQCLVLKISSHVSIRDQQTRQMIILLIHSRFIGFVCVIS
jgi:hypothetical protein